ncbi:uncharacterized protein [Littorina saxatilis]|uniref:Uncharacterized protein n=1 Tax=Littorina saxatilis TaxID=31220 RepID=A0AAN9GG42_9CAEN
MGSFFYAACVIAVIASYNAGTASAGGACTWADKTKTAGAQNQRSGSLVPFVPGSSLDDCKALCEVQAGCVAVDSTILSCFWFSVIPPTSAVAGSTHSVITCMAATTTDSTTTSTVTACASNRFQCDNGRCVPITWVCTGIDGCGDNSDEKNCTTYVCPPGYWKCKNNRCVPVQWLCTDINGCGDNSDEDKCDTNRCIMRRGKKLRTFSNTKERIKFPCKYNAVRDTECGSWKITITPGNVIEADKDKRYIVKTVWLGVERVSDGMKWEGRTDLRIAEKYIEGSKPEPFNKKDGALEAKDIFNFAASSSDDKVIVYEKSGQWMFRFNLYSPGDAWHKSSGFEFICLSDNFQPSGFPDQICGNGTKDEVATFKKSKGWKDSRQAVLFHEVFTNDGIAQTDSDCKTTADTISNKCNNTALQWEAARLCWPVVGKSRFHTCVTRNLERPESAMRHCVEYVCSNFTDPNSCFALSEEIDRCQDLEGVSSKVKAQCAPNLSIKA